MKKLTTEQRFWSKVNKTNKCWLWTAMVCNGYGYFHANQKQHIAHRFAWKLLKGDIPSGKFICHICDVRNCVNPDHLFIGSRQDNVDDMVSKKRQPRGSTHGNISNLNYLQYI